jgi:aspartyl-tRNA(Asn)/glutamyl-tRNA(Gln) amidotransferase subunit B
VSEPDLRTPQEAYAYLSKIKQIIQYLEVCDGNMEEGSLRCDANVSVRPRGREKFGTRTELKNMNSFRNVEKAIDFEIDRQIELIEAGGEVVQQTRLWDTSKMETRIMRSKEEAHDYRYFPEPDLPPIIVTNDLLDEIKAELPELAHVRQERFVEQYQLSEIDAVTLTENRYLADFFEELVSESGHVKASVSLVLSDVLRVLNEQSISIKEFPLSVQRLAELLDLRASDKVSSSAQQTIFNAMLEQDTSALELAEALNVLQVSDTNYMDDLVQQVIEANPDEAQRYREGKKQLMGFFVGQVMKASKGKANPKMANEFVRKYLD